MLALLLVLALRTGPGHAVVAWAIGPLTGGEVRIRGLGGALPDHLRADSVELRDAEGTWLRAENVEIDWRAWPALDNHAEIARATAARIVVLRRPLPSANTSSSPWRIDIASFAVSRLELAQAAIGHAAVLTGAGSFHYSSLNDAAANITARRLDGGGDYRLHATIRDGVVWGTAWIAETGHGVAGGIAGLQDLGPVSLNATASREDGGNVVAFDLQAGALKARGRGTLDLGRRRATVDIAASAPAMRPRRDLGWAALTATAQIAGSFDAPRIQAKLSIEGLNAGGFSAAHAGAGVQGAEGTAELTALTERTVIPGARPDLLAAAPLHLTARIALDKDRRPLAFALDHPLLHVRGDAKTSGPLEAEANISLPSLAPLAALAGLALEGRADFRATYGQSDANSRLALKGILDTRGDTALARLIGHSGVLDLSATLSGPGISFSKLALTGSSVSVRAQGTARDDALDYRWSASLSDVSAVAPRIQGRMDLRGMLAGKPNDLRATASGNARVGTAGFPKQNLTIVLDASGLPKVSSGRFSISGAFDGAPLLLDGRLTRDTPQTLAIGLKRAEWKSLRAEANLVFPESGAEPRGTAMLRVGNLADLSPLVRTRLSGILSADAKFESGKDRSVVAVKGSVRNLVFESAELARLELGGTVGDPFGKPVLALKARAEGIKAGGWSGSANAALEGTLSELAVQLASNGITKSGDRVAVTTKAKANVAARSILVQDFHGTWRDRTLVLAAPATVDLAHGISVDRLSAKVDGAHIDVSGRVAPGLALMVSARNVTPDLLDPLVAANTVDGTLSLDARLSGTTDKPQASFTLRGADLRAHGISQRSFPASELSAHGALRNDVVSLDATLVGGNSLRLTLSGDVPLTAGHVMALKAGGTADLSVASAFLAATGQSLSGKLTADARIGGTFASPRVNGALGLQGGEFRDYARGIRLRQIEGEAQSQGDIVRIVRLNARAGAGTISGSGTIGLAVPGLPVDVTFVAKGARPLVSDRLTATVDASLRLSGKLDAGAKLAGAVRVLQGEILIPDKYPPSVAVLDVRRKGEAANVPRLSQKPIVLDVSVESPGRLFVRGRGLDAELAGKITIAGTTSEPEALGAMDMRRGTLSIAGQTLAFRSGKVSFDGSSLRSRLDPTLDFVAATESGGITATLNVTGYASAPQIRLSSSPSLPQDEVIARILFQESVKSLTPLQLAEIAQVVASLGGVGTGFNPVGALRKSLGLDRLSLGSSASGAASGTTVEAGKYVLRNVYVGAKQDFSGGTRAVVEVDITKNLKAQATVNAGARTGSSPATPDADTGDSVGLSYQFEY